MVQLSEMTLEQAADMVAMQARIGFSRSTMQKEAMSNGMGGALLGGGLGLGAGLLSSAMSPDKKKRWLRNALMGAGLGAGVGGALGYGSDMFSNFQEPTEAENFLNQLKEEKAQEVAKRPPVNDPATGWVQGAYNWMTGQKPGFTAEQNETAKGLGINLEKDHPDLAPEQYSMMDTANEYAGRPGTTALTTLGGTGAGALVDQARKNWVGPNQVMNVGKDQIGKLTDANASLITDFQNRANATGAVVKPGRFGLGGTGAPTVTTPTGAPAPPPPPKTPWGWKNPLNLSPKAPPAPTTSYTVPSTDWAKIQTQTRKIAPRPYSGAMLGGFLGAGSSPFFARMYGNQPAAPK